MLVTMTATLQDRPIEDYLGVVTGGAILGANVFRDLVASVRAARHLGTNGVIGVDLDYETVGNGTMLMASATGTAAKVA